MLVILYEYFTVLALYGYSTRQYHNVPYYTTRIRDYTNTLLYSTLYYTLFQNVLEECTVLHDISYIVHIILVITY